MSACATKKKALALLAIEALAAPEAENLRQHLETCAGCRDYFREIRQVTSRLEEAAAPETLGPSPFLRRRTRQALRQERPQPNLWWRFVLPMAAILVIALVTLPPSPHRSGAKTELRPQQKPGIETRSNFSPTLLNYQIAANQSLEKLDGILAEQARNALPPEPVYRAGISLGE